MRCAAHDQLELVQKECDKYKHYSGEMMELQVSTSDGDGGGGGGGGGASTSLPPTLELK